MATITGTLANDTLFGTSDDYEEIYGLDGDDIIYMGGGDYAQVHGGLGNDTIHVGEGRSLNAYGNEGDDRIISGTVNGSYLGWVDELNGGSGNDTYVWNTNSKRISILEDETLSNIDTLEFGIGINLQDLIINAAQGGSKDWEIRYSSTWISDPTIQIHGPNSSSPYENPLDKITFANGDTYTIINSNTLLADNNDNVVYLAKGSAVFDGGGGNDIIHGTNDTAMLGNYGDTDIIYGGSGDDIIYGYEGNDTLYGGDGNDYIHAGTGQFSDQLYGGNGDDILVGGNAYTGGYGTHFYGGSGNDKIYINSYNAGAYGDEGSDEMYVNFLIPNNHTAVNAHISMYGGEDNDVYIFNRDDANATISRKATIIDDGGSFDTVVFNGDFLKSTTSVAGSPLNFYINDLNYYMFKINQNYSDNQIERFVFSDNNIYTLNYTTYTLSQITATSGDDTIYLSAWHDEFYALGGNDTIYALERDDIVDGGAGDDTLYGEHGNDTLIGGVGNDILNGGIGNDTISYASAAAGTLVKLGSNFTFDDGNGGTDTLSSIENIIGSAYNDDLRGNNEVNIIEGGDGDDNIYGYFGDDILYGGGGDDFLTGAEDNDTLYGDDGADELWGGLGNDTIHGGNGDDAKLDGGDGNDIINGDAGNDTLYGRAGDDTLNGGIGDDVFYGEDGNDIIDGGDGQDFILAGSGDDTLNGGLGYDRLYGNVGADTFVFTDYSQYTSIYDIVHDFNVADGDVLDISDLISAYDPLTESLSDYVSVSYNSVRSYIYIDNDGTGTNASMEYAIRMDGVFWDDADMATLITNGTVIV